MADAALEANKDLVRKFFHLYTQEGVAAAIELLSDDAEWSFPATSRMRARFTKEKALKNFTRIMEMFEGKMTYEILSMTAEEDRVAVEFHGMGKVKIGKDYDNRYHFHFRIRDGKITVIKEYMDTLFVIETLPLGIS